MNAANVFAFLLIFSAMPPQGVWAWGTIGGHLKYQWEAAAYPEESLFYAAEGASSSNHLLDNRWKFRVNYHAWDAQIDYQLQRLQGDRQALSALAVLGNNTLPDNSIASHAIASDDTRLFDLSHVISGTAEDPTLLHRLDRFNLGYSGQHTVLRFGRQVVSWGNGLLFNPMDFFNPFDPTALDKEYKTGDDMLYGQNLFDSGDDLQGVYVIRRDRADGDVHGTESSTALKYHHWMQTDAFFFNALEVDLILAQHYNDELAGVGLIKSMGGAVWRADMLLTHTNQDTYRSWVTNLSYSWTWRNTLWSGALEYFYNGLGISGEDYTLTEIQVKTDLLQRLIRGELYNTGRHYLGASATIELTPLWLATPVVFFNLSDQSALLQLGSQYNLAQNWQLTAALNIPLGPDGTEYGGLKTGVDNATLARDAGIFFQIGFYF